MDECNIKNKKINFVYEFKGPNGYIPIGYDIRTIGIIFDILNNKEYIDPEFFTYRLGYKNKYAILNPTTSTYNLLQPPKELVENKCISELTDDDFENSINVFVIETMHDETIIDYIRNTDFTQIFLESTKKLFENKNFKILFIDNKEGSYHYEFEFFEKLKSLHSHLNMQDDSQLLFITNTSDVNKRYKKYLYKYETSSFMKVKNVEFFIYDAGEPIFTYFLSTNGKSKNVIYDQGVEYSIPVKSEIDKKRKKYFLNLNRNSSRLHRPKLVLQLIKNNIFDKGLISLLKTSDFDYWAEEEGNEEYKTFIKDEYPFVVDYEDERFVSGMHNFFTQKDMWMDTYFSIVSETSVSDKWIFITEKTVRPMIYYHPFIIWGNPGTLQILKDFGFETFPEFFDESYDMIEDENDRLDLIIENVKNLCNMPIEELHLLYQSVIPKLIHNREVLINLYHGDKRLKSILNFITENEV